MFPIKPHDTTPIEPRTVLLTRIVPHGMSNPVIRADADLRRKQ